MSQPTIERPVLMCEMSHKSIPKGQKKIDPYPSDDTKIVVPSNADISYPGIYTDEHSQC